MCRYNWTFPPKSLTVNKRTNEDFVDGINYIIPCANKHKVLIHLPVFLNFMSIIIITKCHLHFEGRWYWFFRTLCPPCLRCIHMHHMIQVLPYNSMLHSVHLMIFPTHMWHCFPLVCFPNHRSLQMMLQQFSIIASYLD